MVKRLVKCALAGAVMATLILVGLGLFPTKSTRQYNPPPHDPNIAICAQADTTEYITTWGWPAVMVTSDQPPCMSDIGTWNTLGALADLAFWSLVISVIIGSALRLKARR